MFKKRVQLSVVLENVPGRLGEICDLLYSLGVDIDAMTAIPIGESGILRMVVSDHLKAIEALEQQQIPFLQTDVLVAQVPNEAGMAAGLGHRFAQAKVNIEYAYFSGGQAKSLTLLVFKVADVTEALMKLELQAGEYN